MLALLVVVFMVNDSGLEEGGHWLRDSPFMPYLKAAHIEVRLRATRPNWNDEAERLCDASMGLI